MSWRTLVWYIPIALLLLWLWQDVLSAMNVRTITYSEFKTYLERGQVVEAEIRPTEIVGTIDPTRAPAVPSDGEPAGEVASDSEDVPSDETAEPQEPAPRAPKASDDKTEAEAASSKEKFIFRTVRVEDPKLIEQLEAAGVKFSGVHPGFLSEFIVSWVLPMALVVGLWIFLSRRLSSAGQAIMSIGRSKARMATDSDTGVTFNDVAGCDEAKYELQEVVDFLRNPDRYVSLGAKIPRGVLLVGPPGTGKTLLARAVAGEAKVPFFSLSGSDFVEMFVGVGAARVRDLFQQAKSQAPCIIFIDELDAIGRERGVHIGTVNDEREQTLNQLLVEMDGFEANLGVILLAATNRPEVLDRAILRPGRFDRQVVVDAPDIDGREAILKVHARNKPLADDVNLRRIAQGTPGFSGADLANAMNEAALLAARRNAKVIHQSDLEEAVEKVVAGPERRSRRLDEELKKRVAYHEVGHALVGAYSEHADPIHKISIVPRGRAALGYTLQLPTGDQFLFTRSELIDRLKGLLGGRAAEDVVYGEISTGAENDLERATSLARRMICMYGMSDRMGLVHCAQREGFFLPGQDGKIQRDCSEATAREIDDEVKQLLDQAYRSAKQILIDHREELERVTQELLQHETLDAERFMSLLGRKAPSGTATDSSPADPSPSPPATSG